jgi:capsular polysaccharide transport system permease protein
MRRGSRGSIEGGRHRRMTDYRPSDRTVGAADIGLHPGRAPGRIARLFAILNIWFWVIVGLPTLVAGVYFFAIASDLYLSEAKFLVRGQRQSPLSGMSSLLAVTGSAHDQNAAAVADFIMSRDAVRLLDRNQELRAVFARPQADFVSRFPGLARRADFEALYRHYRGFVSVNDDSDGIVTLEVKAYRPGDAQRIAEALIGYSEALVNRLNERARQDALALARHEVGLAEAKITGIQDALTAYRVKESMIDPKSASAGVLRLIQQMESAETNARAQLSQLLKNAPHNPQIPLVRNRIAALATLIAEQRAKLTGAKSSIVASMSGYEHLIVARKLAEQALASAFASLEAARLEAQRQQLYLEIVARPNLADYPLYPRRIESFALVFGCCLLAYAIAWLLVEGVREHASA